MDELREQTVIKPIRPQCFAGAVYQWFDSALLTLQYGLANSESFADYKAVSMNVIHASMEITDAIYSNLNDGEIQNRINGQKKKDRNQRDDELEQFRQFSEWKERKVK